MNKVFKIISLTSYSLIILMGQMIGLPFIFWLLFTSIDFGNSDQIFAICGIIGIVLNFTKYRYWRLVKILSFILMLLPIAIRLTETPIEKFNYLLFQVPLFIFVVTYLILIINPFQKNKRTNNEADAQ